MDFSKDYRDELVEKLQDQLEEAQKLNNKQAAELEELRIADQFTEHIINPNLKQHTMQLQSRLASMKNQDQTGKTPPKLRPISQEPPTWTQPNFEEGKLRAKLVAMS